MTNLPKTRKEAKLLNEKFYYTGNECKHGHIAKRLTSSGGCYECQLIANKKSANKWREEHRDEYNKKAKKNYHKRKSSS